MSKLTSDLLSFAYQISLHPQMFAYTPEEAHGKLESLSWVILHEFTKKELGVCVRIARPILKEVMSRVYLSECYTPLLCNGESNSSFEDFIVNSKTYLDKLCAYIESNKAK